MNIKELALALEKFEALSQEWVKPINQAIEQNLSRVNRDGYTFADFQRDIDEVREKQNAKLDLSIESDALVNRLCHEYLEATSAERELLRGIVINKPGIQDGLLSYLRKAAKEIESPEDIEWLRIGLAAASIEDCARDFRDVLIALAELYVAAEQAGIDPISHFQYVATLSSKRVSLGSVNQSMSEILNNFHTFAILKERKVQAK